MSSFYILCYFYFRYVTSRYKNNKQIFYLSIYSWAKFFLPSFNALTWLAYQTHRDKCFEIHIFFVCHFVL
jgi:hypothetical protein